MKRKLFIDFDGVISNSIYTICKLYNNDFCNYKDYNKIEWKDIDTWDFDELTCATREYIDHYFNQPRFFENIKLMKDAEYYLGKLSKLYNIYIVSMGNYPNLVLKQKYIKDMFPYCEFIGCDFDKYLDKSHVDMNNSVFVDDSAINLITSNAATKICFGEDYLWNNGWNGIRSLTWVELYNLLHEINKIEELTEQKSVEVWKKINNDKDTIKNN